MNQKSCGIILHWIFSRSFFILLSQSFSSVCSCGPAPSIKKMVQVLHHMAVSRYEKQIRGNPGHRAGDAHRYISKHRHQAKAHKGARCHLAYPGNNGQPGIPKSLYHEPHRIDKDKRNIEQAVADEEQTRVPQDSPSPLSTNMRAIHCPKIQSTAKAMTA